MCSSRSGQDYMLVARPSLKGLFESTCQDALHHDCLAGWLQAVRLSRDLDEQLDEMMSNWSSQWTVSTHSHMMLLGTAVELHRGETLRRQTVARHRGSTLRLGFRPTRP
jgi:hypothetical protein